MKNCTYALEKPEKLPINSLVVMGVTTNDQNTSFAGPRKGSYMFGEGRIASRGLKHCTSPRTQNIGRCRTTDR